MIHLSGNKTLAKMKEWTKKWFSDNRHRAPLLESKPGSKTQSWIRKHVSLNHMMHLRPTFYNYLPRQEGILLSKARTNRWTSCNWYLNKIGKRLCENCINKPSDLECPTCVACNTCKVKDDLGHVLNNCKRHEESRSIMLLKTGNMTINITDLLISDSQTNIRKLGQLLVAIDESRKTKKNSNTEKDTNTQNTPE